MEDLERAAATHMAAVALGIDERQEINRVLFVSIEHLHRDCRHADRPGWASMSGEYGFLVYCPDRPTDRGTLPACLRKATAYARSIGCSYIVFDRDADLCSALKMYGD